jgi:hypothetical protein
MYARLSTLQCKEREMADEIALDDFISDTIKGVISGIVKAQEFANEKDAYINPVESFQTGNAELRVAMAKEIQFDLIVTASTSEEAKVGIAVLFAPITGGVKASGKDSWENVNRVSFSIPVTFPVMGV